MVHVMSFFMDLSEFVSQPTITCSKLTLETQGVKYVQS